MSADYLFYKEPSDRLRSGEDYGWEKKEYKCRNCDNADQDLSVASCPKCDGRGGKPSKKKERKEKDHKKHDEEHRYIAKAVAAEQKVVSRSSIKFTNAVVNEKSKIAFEASGYRFKLAKGSYQLKLSATLAEKIKGSLILNITGHDDIEHSFDSNSFSHTFSVHLKSDAYLNFKLKLPHSVKLMQAVLYVQ
jgi:hypothetical protein